MHAATIERDPTFEAQGFTVRRNAVPAEVATAVVRRLNLEIARRGLSSDEIEVCSRGTYFPHLRWEPEVRAMQDYVSALVQPAPQEQWADPQLLLRFPEPSGDGQPWGHVDEPPPWAAGRRYRVIAGVALSASRASDGCLAVWPGSHTRTITNSALVELRAGDVVLMHPKLWHASTVNSGAWIRYAVYFRLLTAGAGA
jgi:ectoine hydroxylase-related dioxygenase (phytanoyl-CoA dioxygenase family)